MFTWVFVGWRFVGVLLFDLVFFLICVGLIVLGVCLLVNVHADFGLVCWVLVSFVWSWCLFSWCF